jgi:hypothetical protein
MTIHDADGARASPMIIGEANKEPAASLPREFGLPAAWIREDESPIKEIIVEEDRLRQFSTSVDSEAASCLHMSGPGAHSEEEIHVSRPEQIILPPQSEQVVEDNRWGTSMTTDVSRQQVQTSLTFRKR